MWHLLTIFVCIHFKHCWNDEGKNVEIRKQGQQIKEDKKNRFFGHF